MMNGGNSPSSFINHPSSFLVQVDCALLCIEPLVADGDVKGVGGDDFTTDDGTVPIAEIEGVFFKSGGFWEAEAKADGLLALDDESAL